MTMTSVTFGLICTTYFINSTSTVLTLNIISYFWPLLFLLGIVFGLFMLKNYKTNSLFDNLMSIFVICLYVSSFGFYLFFLFLAKISSF